MLDITQQQLADAVGLSRPYIASIENGSGNPTIEVVERIARTLGIELDLCARQPVVLNGPQQRDLLHARCSGYVSRRLIGLGWETRREVTIVSGRTRGWIDVLAFDPRRRILLVIEVKTWLDDLGAIERQLDWYKREAAARIFGIRPVRTVGWLLLLATAEVDAAIHRNGDAFDIRFAARAGAMRSLVAGEAEPTLDDSGATVDGIALIDPRRRRRDWLMPSRADGRRSPAPYASYAAAVAAMSA
jgi:transcriptional regulator with XRE-family HTH domain